MMYLLIAVYVGWVVIGIVAMVMIWRKDCREIGKENLAVSLKERLRAFFLCFVLPMILRLLARKV